MGSRKDYTIKYDKIALQHGRTASLGPPLTPAPPLHLSIPQCP